jgi:hypothetical protein
MDEYFASEEPENSEPQAYNPPQVEHIDSDH